MSVLTVSEQIEIPMEEFSLTFSRSGGPGGQNVNKISSRVQLKWLVTTTKSISEDVKERFLEKFGNRINQEGELLVSSQKHREQKANIDECFEKLKEMILSVEHPPTVRKPTKPAKIVREKRIEGKKIQSAKKQMRRSVSLDHDS